MLWKNAVNRTIINLVIGLRPVKHVSLVGAILAGRAIRKSLLCQMHTNKRTRKANGSCNKLLQDANIPSVRVRARAYNCSRHSNYDIYRYNRTLNVTINYGTKVPLSCRH